MPIRNAFLWLPVALLGFVVPASPANATSDGAPDESFGSNGVVLTRVNNADTGASGIKIQSNGKIVVVGGVYSQRGDSDVYVARYQPNGFLDQSFGQSGVTITDVSQLNNSATDVAIQPDGRIVVSGRIGDDAALFRYNSDGSLDTSFDGDGTTRFASGNVVTSFDSTTIQSDGKILAVGTYDPTNSPQFLVVRYNSDGSLDTSFDGDGFVVRNIALGSAGASAIAIQSDGKIVVAGSAVDNQSRNFASIRVNSDGTLDNSFDGDGISIIDFQLTDEAAHDIAIQSDGKIVLAGHIDIGSDRGFAVARLNVDGSLDTSFDGDGRAVGVVGTGDGGALSVAVARDGKIVLTGFSYMGSGERIVLLRYNSNGAVDPSFGANGQVNATVGAFSVASAMAIQSDGKVVVAGYSSVNSQGHALVMRFDSPSSTAVNTPSGNASDQQPTAPASDAPVVRLEAPAAMLHKTANGKVTLRWRGVNGSASYVVTSSNGTLRCDTTETSCSVSKLTNGRSYTFLVYSVTANGERSEAATRMVVTPGFLVKRSSLKANRSFLVGSVITSPSKGVMSLRVTSGKCRVVGRKIVTPKRVGTCRLRVSIARRGSYAAMSTTIKLNVSS